MERKTRERICLDSDTCIAIVNNLPSRSKILAIILERDVCISSITAFELLRRKTNIEKMEEIISGMDVLAFDKESAEYASKIEKQLKSKGRMVAFNDIFIAATAIMNRCELLTLNKKNFENIEGLKLLDF